MSRLVAVQAQDYAGARWALGLRACGLQDGDVERAFDAGEILRLHVLRPTWHFVAPTDIRWLLALTAPRVRKVSAYYDRQHGVDASVLRRSRVVFEQALRDGKHLTRAELADALKRAGVHAAGPRLSHLTLHAELDGLICSGPRRGKQPTHALLEERVAAARARTRDESLAELATRYFSSHGPATVRDYAWWSGLSVADARAGIAMATGLQQETAGGLTYWSASVGRLPRRPTPHVLLLPNYDEYVIAYKDRGLLLGAGASRRRPGDEYVHLLIVDGQLRGTWRRHPRERGTLEVRLYRRLDPAERQALRREADRYGRFLGVTLKVESRQPSG